MALIVLITAAIFVHHIAATHVDIMGSLSAKMKTTAASRAQLVSHIASHPWFVMPYLLAFVGALLWMQFRKLPCWSLWLTFTFLALPVLGYIWICFRITTTNFISVSP